MKINKHIAHNKRAREGSADRGCRLQGNDKLSSRVGILLCIDSFLVIKEQRVVVLIYL